MSPNMFNFKEMPIPQSASAAFSAYASFATTIMLVRSMANELIPRQLISFFSSIFFYIFGSFSSQTKFKSSLIAAIANYLKFDVYDLDLSSIYDNSELRRIMLSTTNGSILVIEDIDCSAHIQNRETGEHDNSTKFTLLGMLNSIDGLWSSCGDERIIIFPTNHKERLDPALLRPGRMDVHINMSYLSLQGFKVLATNYIDGEATKHHLYGEIEELIEEMELSPAEIAEELVRSEDVNAAVMKDLIEFLKRKREEQRNKQQSESNGNKKSLEEKESNKKGIESKKKNKKKKKK